MTYTREELKKRYPNLLLQADSIGSIFSENRKILFDAYEDSTVTAEDMKDIIFCESGKETQFFRAEMNCQIY